MSAGLARAGATRLVDGDGDLFLGPRHDLDLMLEDRERKFGIHMMRGVPR
jgi:hypothetical protein